jgi:hypothetical protein
VGSGVLQSERTKKKDGMEKKKKKIDQRRKNTTFAAPSLELLQLITEFEALWCAIQ